VFHVKQGDRLDLLHDLILRWNQRINLVGRADIADLRRRHIEDSAQLLPLLPPGEGPAGDLGSGAGFPGLVLAILTTRPWHLVESDRRKAAFLATAAAELGLGHLRVHVTRIEDVVLPPLAVVTARALAPLPQLLVYAQRLLAPEGVAIFPKGRTAQDELTAARADWHMAVDAFPSRTSGTSTILRISGIRRAGP